MNTDVLATGLRVSVDWVAFTVKDEKMTVKSVIEFLGFDVAMFSQAPRGANGYKSMMNLDGYPLSVLSDGKPDMGIHVNVGGSAIGHMLKHYYNARCSPTPFGGDAFEVDDFAQTVMVNFLSEVNKIATFSRLDIAVDDCGDTVHFTLPDVSHALSMGLCVSKFRNYSNNITRKVSRPDELVGGTIYFGSGSSDIRLRIYDKRLEQNAKAGAEVITYDWVRWEFQLRNERATSFAHLLLSGVSFPDAVVGMFNNYFRIIVNDDSNRSRCSISPRWLAFLGSLEKVRLYVSDHPKTLDDKKAWLIQQVLPTLTGVILADGGSLDIITDHWDASVARMKHDMLSLVQERQRELSV